MRRGRQYQVCAAVISSDLQFDARVWKEARSLAGGGWSMRLVGTVFDVDGTRQHRDPSGIDVCEVPLGWRTSGKSRRRRACAVARVWLEVLRTDARVYHAHDIHVAIPAWLASRLRGATLVYDAHELWAEAYASSLKARVSAKIRGLVERLVVSASDAVITTNDSRAQVLSKRYGRREITVLANVPLLEAHPSAKDPGYPRGKRVILFLGRISADGRAFRESIKALRLLDDDVVLVILGFGWESERDRIRAWAQEEGVADRVELLPPLPFEELAGAAASATVGLVPLYKALLNHTLGDTNKLHEYLMGGLPVAASGLPEIRRVVESGDPPVGELFDPLSPESIAQAIRAVIDDPRYPERRVQARKMAIERFNWTIEERKLLSLYERLTENGSIGAAATLERA